MPIAKPLSERFFAKVVKGSGRACWRWIGAKTKLGYGVINKGSRGAGLFKAHRASWIIHFGAIPKGMSVAHKCNNPECCNPRHLYIATHAQNMRDAGRDGLMRMSDETKAKLSAAHSGAKLSEDHKKKLSAARAKWWKTRTSIERTAFLSLRARGWKLRQEFFDLESRN